MPSPHRLLVAPLLVAACGGAPSSTTEASTGGATTTATTTASSSAGAGTTTDDAPTSTTATPTTTGGTTGDDGVAGLELMQRLAGLWTGPASMTPLGTFPLMNMDIRAASGQVLFGRVDLDAANNLRFALEIEAPEGEPVLVYRNGGYFLGLLRDSRTALVEHGADVWRFCFTGPQGCDYIDASFSFTGADELLLDVKVKGTQHVYWEARRDEARALPEPFPADEAPLAGDAPFPDMPTLKVDVSWQGALEQDGAVWVILSTADCDLQLSCVHSRSLTAAASAGATSATLTLEQIHTGPYKLNAILDRNGNLADTLYPDKGDGVAAPNKAIAVAPSGETAVQTTILLTL